MNEILRDLVEYISALHECLVENDTSSIKMETIFQKLIIKVNVLEAAETIFNDLNRQKNIPSKAQLLSDTIREKEHNVVKSSSENNKTINNDGNITTQQALKNYLMSKNVASKREKEDLQSGCIEIKEKKKDFDPLSALINNTMDVENGASDVSSLQGNSESTNCFNTNVNQDDVPEHQLQNNVNIVEMASNNPISFAEETMHNISETNDVYSLIQNINNKTPGNVQVSSTNMDEDEFITHHDQIEEMCTANLTKQNDTTGQFPCKMCNKSFSTAHKLKLHEIRVHNKKVFTCKVCSASFSRKAHLSVHMGTHTGTGYRPFECNICFATSSTSGNLRTHMRTHTGERPYACEICNKRFTQSSSLNTHIKRIHVDKQH